VGQAHQHADDTKVVFTVNGISQGVVDRIDRFCDESGMKKYRVVEDAIEEYLDRHKAERRG
jgi:hypothetical protein